MTNKVPITAIVLTLDEAQTIEGCLASLLPFFDEIIVLDSYSSDDTPLLVRQAGVQFVRHAFDNYAAQRNYALNDVKKKHDWVFFLDADERFTVEAFEELGALIGEDGLAPYALMRIRRKDVFFGRWLKRSTGYPTWFGRLCRVGAVHIEREINEEYNTHGKVGFLEAHILHYPFMKGLSDWVSRQNRYSTMEAARLFAMREPHFPRRLISSDPAARRIELKKILYRLPGRPLIAFIYLYTLRLGLLDGYPGFLYCLLRAYYELMISIKLKELTRKTEQERV
jgi:glycosyltransferase involved in cell wall biosynthesis